jgi:hypothetical protein
MKKINVCFLVSGLLLALLLTSCGGGGTGILSKTPSDVIKSSINDLKNKNYKGIIKYYIHKRRHFEDDRVMYYGGERT